MKESKNKVYALLPEKDARKSFYEKAIIKESKNFYDLYSYCTLVCRISRKDHNNVVLNKSVSSELLFSNTTMRHIKEFIYQFSSLTVNTKKELLKLKRV